MRTHTELDRSPRPTPAPDWRQWDRSTRAAELVALIAHLDPRTARSLEVLPAASAAAMEDLEVRLGRPLPPELRQLYGNCGGLRIATENGVVVELAPAVGTDRIPGVVEVPRSSWSEPPWQLDPDREVFRHPEVARCNQTLLCLGWFRGGETTQWLTPPGVAGISTFFAPDAVTSRRIGAYAARMHE